MFKKYYIIFNKNEEFFNKYTLLSNGGSADEFWQRLNSLFSNSDLNLEFRYYLSTISIISLRCSRTIINYFVSAC